MITIKQAHFFPHTQIYVKNAHHIYLSFSVILLQIIKMSAKKRVAVLCGGYTAERNISLGSGDVVMRNMDLTKYEPYKVIVNADKWIVEPEDVFVDLDTFSCDIDGNKIQFDVAFIAIHGSPGEDGKLQGYLDMKKIPYTSCDVIASAITFNKNFCKSLLKEVQVPMAKGLLIQRNDKLDEQIKQITDHFSLPLFVKPNNNGSSYGVSKIKEITALKEAIVNSFNYDEEVLVEEGLTGTEVTCGVYRYQNKIIVLPICEIVAGKHDFFDYTAKYTPGESDEIIPARISDIAANKVSEHSSKIYQYLGCKGVVRIDYILAEETPHFLEVNTIPGISEASIVPKMAVASGLTLPEFFGRLIEEAAHH
ncbi:MAG: D-alanine--D-alanine ligase [Chitinophagales bacterium]|nr:D-alanine--D-alanine ligase [Chitinophagales bacterium]